MDHDYCSVPEPSALDTSLTTVEDLTKELEDLRKEMQELRVQREFGLQQFAGSDADIRFYTRFPSYNHLMAFWFLIEPSIYKMVRVSRAKSAAKRNEEVTHARPSARQLLQPIDEFFLFLVFLSVGLKERDLAHRFNIHESTVSRIIATWTSDLATSLGSQCIWLTPAEVKAYIPEGIQRFPRHPAARQGAVSTAPPVTAGDVRPSCCATPPEYEGPRSPSTPTIHREGTRAAADLPPQTPTMIPEQEHKEKTSFYVGMGVVTSAIVIVCFIVLIKKRKKKTDVLRLRQKRSFSGIMRSS